MIGPRSDCNKHSHPREHYTKKKGNWKPKKQFNTKEEANEFLKRYNRKNYKSYKCSICHKWHIGFFKEDN